MKLIFALSCLVIVLVTAGCTSIAGRSMGVVPPVAYPSVQADWGALHGGGHFPGWVLYPYAAIDLPFSAVVDTLFLPYDLGRDEEKWKRKQEWPKPGIQRTRKVEA
jgi:uncharacterized protein YceK